MLRNDSTWLQSVSEDDVWVHGAYIQMIYYRGLEGGRKGGRERGREGGRDGKGWRDGRKEKKR